MNQPLMTIVMPAYNEAHRLPITLPRVIDFITSRPEPLDVIVVNNNSRDETRTVAERIAAEHRFVHVIDQPIPGKGAAVRAGMLAAQGAVRLHLRCGSGDAHRRTAALLPEKTWMAPTTSPSVPARRRARGVTMSRSTAT